MQKMQLSQSNEDYLKNIWLLGEQTEKAAGVRALAKRMDLSPSTVSEAIKKLTEQGYVDHHRYAGIKLTELGRKIAVQMARKHRLIETYLVEHLDYSWDQVHAEAEALEHAVSDYFVQRIDEILGHPYTDPHGAPIPSADGVVIASELMLLKDVAGPRTVTIARVCDEDSEILAFLARANLVPGVKCEITAISKALGTITLAPCTDVGTTIKNAELQITFPVASQIWISAD